jgi:ABC-type antimicrobial peptide transport system permease subunit
VRTYDRVVREAVFGQWVLARLFTAFGLVALFLAAAGLYGVIAFSVRQRTREIGVRRALGAPTARLLRGLLGRCAWQVGMGLALGLVFAWPFASLLVGPLRGFDPADPRVYALVLGALALVAIAAILVPARRALRIDPLIALRHE